MMQSPEFRTAMSNPQTIQQIMALHQAMGGIPGLGAPPMGGTPEMRSTSGVLDSSTNSSAQAPSPMINPQLLGLLSGMQQANNFTQPPASQEPPEVRFQTQLAQLVDMVLFL